MPDTVFFPIYQVCSRAGTLVDNPVNCEVPEYTGVQATSLQRKLNENVKITAKEHIAMKHMDQWMGKLKSIAVQGKNLELAWLDMKKLNFHHQIKHTKMYTLCIIATLPTAVNLQRWKLSSYYKCKLCQGRQTTANCSNICKVGRLNTGRWTWRHNTMLDYVLEC